MTHASVSTADARASLNFIRPQETKPRFHSSALTGGAPEYFYELESHTVPLHDMRGVADRLSIDREGFELHRQPTIVADLYDDAAITEQYIPEVEAFLNRRFAASQVAVFDVTRRSDAPEGAPNPDGKRGPASQLHVDYTIASGPQRARDVLGEAEAARLEQAGARIIQVNVWRPIRGPVERSPLALADVTTIREQDLVATDQIFPDRIGEIYNVAHAPAQRWYQAEAMTPDEVLLIKGWDSLDDGRARFTPHGAARLADIRDGAPARESIEVRTLVVIEDDTDSSN